MCIFTFVLELISSVARIIILDSIFIDYVLYILEDISLSVFYFYNCFKVYQRLQGSGFHGRSRWRRMTFRILLSAVGIILFDVGFLMNGVGAFIDKMWMWCIMLCYFLVLD